MLRQPFQRTLRRLAFASLLLLPCAAQASSTTELAYTRAQIFSGALRYLRIDLGYEVTERDADAAYLLFSYTPLNNKQPTFGAIEIIEREKSVRLTVKLPQMPSYHEAVIRDGLVRKLKEEYGAERSEPRKPSPPKDGFKDGSKDGSESDETEPDGAEPPPEATAPSD